MDEQRNQSRAASRAAWIAACVLLVIAGVAVRAFIHTRSPITPAIDGAYYAIQPRSLLMSGKLDYPDMPVKFALTAALITLPVLNGDSVNRLALVAMVPGAAAFALAFAGGPAGLRGVWPAGLVLLAALASAPGGARFASRPCIDPASLEELRTMRDLVPEHRRALLVARHGLEFWANWAIDVNTRQSGIPSNAFDRYDRVLVLTEARPFDPMRDENPHGGLRGEGPPRGPRPRGMRPPPGSRAVFEGRHFRLFEVPRETRDGGNGEDADLP